jgi:F-type H+-transporting ATPase subunit c
MLALLAVQAVHDAAAPVVTNVKNTPIVHAGKAIALALGIGAGAASAGAGIGNIFGSMIQSVARQPELRGELQGLMWLGFALTEAVVFYGFVGGLLGYVLV